jgi:hypothetical protein
VSARQTIIADDDYEDAPPVLLFPPRAKRELTREEVQQVERCTIRESFGGRVWPPEVWRLSEMEIPK